MDLDKQVIPVHLIQLQETNAHSLATMEKIYEKSGIDPVKGMSGMWRLRGLKIIKLAVKINKVFVASGDTGCSKSHETQGETQYKFYFFIIMPISFEC
jgi:hypothetical protein